MGITNRAHGKKTYLFHFFDNSGHFCLCPRSDITYLRVDPVSYGGPQGHSRAAVRAQYLCARSAWNRSRREVRSDPRGTGATLQVSKVSVLWWPRRVTDRCMEQYTCRCTSQSANYHTMEHTMQCMGKRPVIRCMVKSRSIYTLILYYDIKIGATSYLKRSD